MLHARCDPFAHDILTRVSVGPRLLRRSPGRLWPLALLWPASPHRQPDVWLLLPQELLDAVFLVIAPPVLLDAQLPLPPASRRFAFVEA